MLKLQVKASLGTLREPVDRKSWLGLPPIIVNAFYNPSFNDISKQKFYGQ